jgi:hypothetical protein
MSSGLFYFFRKTAGRNLDYIDFYRFAGKPQD